MTLTVAPTSVIDDQSAPPLIRVLFADDSSAMRTLARYSLTARKGFSVAEACDGAEALTMFEASRPDCVVLDIEMPRLGGFETLDELQRRCPEVPVVMLSGFSDPALTSKARSRGAAAYLEKSSEMGRLAETVRRVSQAAAEPVPAAALPESSPAQQPPATTSAAAVNTDTADLRRLEYVISHDFAEPVRIMGGFATLLHTRYAESLDSSGQAFLGHLVDGAQRMQVMVDDLLTYSRAGRLVARAETVQLDAIVGEVRAELGAPFNARGAVISVGELPPARGDAALMKTVIRHLVRNGLTFNTSSTPTVHVAGRLSERAAVFTVTDNGIGISPAQLDVVFELFRRLNTREEYAGTGTGLALCRRLLSLQSGTIALSPTSSGGTTVTFTLPATDNHRGDRP